MIKAILFDFDGVLAHTFPYHFKAWQIVIHQYFHFDPDAHSIQINEGSPAYKIAQAIVATQSVDLDEAAARSLAEQKNLIFRKISRAGPYQEIPDILSQCRSLDLKLGLVTGTTLENIHRVLSGDILDQFQIVIEEGDTRRGKPFPDPYQTAAENLETDPANCLVVENAPLGIQAAKAAGCFCIALQTTLEKEHLNHADVILKDHRSLQKQIKLIIEKHGNIDLL
ncbi:HAD-IA family hydrolase [candidate division KSB1 bacterium]|nr:HAD-IA family hydrolase [candidate division KSB1 bacterium]